MPDQADISDLLAEARREHDKDINHLANLRSDQLEYLARVGTIQDDTEGLECGHDVGYDSWPS